MVKELLLERYWLNQLAGEVANIKLLDKLFSDEVEEFTETVEFIISEETVSGVKQLTNGSDLGRLAYFNTILNILIYKNTNEKEFGVLTPELNIGNEYDSENICFLRAAIQEEDTVKELLINSKNSILNLVKHQGYNFYNLLDKMKGNSSFNEEELHHIAFLDEKVQKENKLLNRCDLIFTSSIEKLGWSIQIKYGNEFNKSSVEVLAQQFNFLIHNLWKNLDLKVKDISNITENEVNQVVNEFNFTKSDFPHQSLLHELVEKQAKLSASKTAINCEENRITYSQLNELSDQLAAFLQEKYTVKPNEIIGILLDRTEWQVIAILGIIKSGAAYVAIDKNWPAARKKYVIEDSNVKIIVTQEAYIEEVKKNNLAHVDIHEARIYKEKSKNIEKIAHSEDLVYIKYTSGSTGKPKGVEITHRSVVNFLSSMLKSPGINPEDNFLAVTTYTFDISVLEFFLPLVSGATLILASEQELSNLYKLSGLIDQENITMIQATPSFWQMLINFGWNTTRKLKILCGGENLPAPLGKKLLQYSGELWNMYGPTETTIWSTTMKINNEAEIKLIGKPIDNTQVYILNKNKGVTPIGAIGELFIAGEGLARGYRNKAQLTNEKFIKNCFDNATDSRMYSTGDLGRWKPDGNIEYIGRIDTQVKIRGYRIELGEIESVAERHESVEKAVVLVEETSQGTKELIMFYSSVHLLTEEELKSFLVQFLPAYMIPSYLQRVESFPLNSNGKVDKKALQAKLQKTTHETDELDPPRNYLEFIMIDSWKKALLTDKIGIKSNFFKLGGHSLKAAQVVSAIRSQLEVEIDLGELFKYPTVEQLAQVVATAKPNKAPGIQKTADVDTYTISIQQKGLWLLYLLKDKKYYFNISFGHTITNLNLDALHWTLQTLIARHESLRTVFVEEDDIIKHKILPPDSLASIPEHFDFRNDPDKSQKVGELSEKEMRIPFDLEKGPMLRVQVVRVEDSLYVILITIHHTFCDAWSRNLLSEQFLSLYESYAANKELPVNTTYFQFKDYFSWRDTLTDQNKVKQYISETFGSLNTIPLTDKLYSPELLDSRINQQKINALRPAPDFADPDLQLLYQVQPVPVEEGAAYRYVIEEDLTNKLNMLAKENNLTLFTVLVAAFNVLLFKLSERKDHIIEFPSVDREHEELKGIVGWLTSGVFCRNVVNENITVKEFLFNVQTNLFLAKKHRHYPFPYILRDCNNIAGMDHVISAQLNLVNIKNKTEAITDFQHAHYGNMVPFYNLSCSFTEYNNGIDAFCIYKTSFFSKEKIEYIFNSYKHIINEFYSKKDKLITDINQ